MVCCYFAAPPNVRPERIYTRNGTAMTEVQYLLRPVGFVESCLKSKDDCPKQGFEGAPEAWLAIDPMLADALDGLAAGDEILILTWLHQGNREVLKVRPRGEAGAPLRGVFSTRSPDRPNPIGLHRVVIREIESGSRLRVYPLEALDGTPILDIKPVLTQPAER
jgi:tRNA-Thr(GGU) m(6)t(6)A37 methyltransferase TsaA